MRRIITSTAAEPSPAPTSVAATVKRQRLGQTKRRRNRAFMPWKSLPSKGRLIAKASGMWNRHIYALVCPETDVIMYVGQTFQDLAVRLRQHIESPTNPAMARWIEALQERAMEPQIRLISLAPDLHWEDVERHWIAYIKVRAALLNVDPGGVCRDSSGKPIPKKLSLGKMFDFQAEYERRTGEQWSGFDDLGRAKKPFKGKRDPWARARGSASERAAQASKRQMGRARKT